MTVSPSKKSDIVLIITVFLSELNLKFKFWNPLFVPSIIISQVFSSEISIGDLSFKIIEGSGLWFFEFAIGEVPTIWQ